MEAANTLAYFDTATITSVKSFYSGDPWHENNLVSRIGKIFMAVKMSFL
jgi:hypothetical protein